MLAFFIPGIVYLADAVGTQTETIVVRGLSVGVEMRKMLLPELLAGAAIGLRSPRLRHPSCGGVGERPTSPCPWICLFLLLRPRRRSRQWSCLGCLAPVTETQPSEADRLPR